MGLFCSNRAPGFTNVDARINAGAGWQGWQTMGVKTVRLCDRVSLIRKTGVASFLRRTLMRLQDLGVKMFQGGHVPSFGKARMMDPVATCLRGDNPLVDGGTGYHPMRRRVPDILADHDRGDNCRD